MNSTFLKNILTVFLFISSFAIVSGQESIIIQHGDLKTTFPAFHNKLPVEFQKRLNTGSEQNTTNTKSAQIQNTKIDTAVVESVLSLPKRYIYLYNANGNNSRKIIQEYNNSTWVNKSKDTITYDASGNKLRTIWYNYTGSQWINSSLEINNYGSQNSLLNSVSKSWSNNTWNNNDTSYYNYDANWNKVAYYKKNWDGSKWVNDSYEIYTYNSNEQLSASYRYVWQDSVWAEQQRYLFSYDQNGNVDTSLIQKGDRQQWVNYYMETYSYDGSNNKTSYVGKFWSSTNTDWENSEQYTYTYNSSGYQTSAVGQVWNNNQWVNHDQGTYFHNTYGGLESAITQLWKSNSWVDTTLAQYNFDLEGNATSGDYYIKNGSSWDQNNDGLLEVSYNYNIDQAYFTGYHVSASYPVTTGINNIWQDITQMNNAPNPARGYTNLQLENDKTLNIQLKLYNLNGEVIQNIFEGTINKGLHSYLINLTGIPAGIYIATVSSEGNSKSVKIIHFN
ncbi:MAG: T9SS type A sorting domain-containing protein [Bacteroidales bacterium]|nr:T9SS type A sorting domain-containing protein [Bacteroidales bacterium]